MTQLLAKKKNGEATMPSLFSEFFDTNPFFNNAFQGLKVQLPAVNIRETNSEFLIDVAAPGLDKKDFKINVENRLLSISAENETSSSKEDDHYTRREYSYNSFSRSFQVPEYVKSDDIKATYNNGVLQITLPKKEDARKGSAKEISVS